MALTAASAIAKRNPMTAWSGSDPDAALLERVALHDRAALGELYNRHRVALFGYLVRLCGDVPTAEELLQDTLVAVWHGAAGYEGRSSVRTWIIGIGRRQAHDRLRRKGLPTADEAELTAVPSAAAGPEDVALASARQEELAALVGRLSPLHREVLHLAFAEGLQYREIAEVLRVPLGTVRSRLHNAKRELAALVASHGGEL